MSGSILCAHCGGAADVLPHHCPASVDLDLEREIAAEREEFDDRDDDECSHCTGEGLCWDGSDPLGDCPDYPHPCHACGGSGRGKDQTLW